jgi:AbrB family looped-hinge helix DNA binding protein
MQTAIKSDYKEEWVKILTKGMLTIPKAFRDELNLKEGEVARIKKIGQRLVIEPREVVDYEAYSDGEFKKMLFDDRLPPKLANIASSIWEDIE